MDISFEQLTNEAGSGSHFDIIVRSTDASESDIVISEGCFAMVRRSRRAQMSRSVLRVVEQARYANEFAQRNFRDEQPVEEQDFYYPLDTPSTVKIRKLNRRA
jgi:hypothetical protein